MIISTTWLEALAAIGSILFAVFVWFVSLLARLVQRTTRTEDKVDSVVKDMLELVKNKDSVHSAILEQMKFDRDATDRRLRFMEEFWMNSGLGQGRK